MKDKGKSDEKGKEKNKWNWKKISLIVVTLTSIIGGGLLNIFNFFEKKDTIEDINDMDFFSGDKSVNIGKMNGNINIDHEKEAEDKDKKIELLNAEVNDLSTIGAYLTSGDSLILENDNKFYKKGIVINFSLRNPGEEIKTIKECSIIIDNVSDINVPELVLFPVENEDGISIYAMNNGSADLNNESICIKSTFNNDWRESSNVVYKSKDEIMLSLSYGEVKVVHKYKKSDLDNIFEDSDKNGIWLHVFSSRSDSAIQFGDFICNIVQYDGGYDAFINQGGSSWTDKIIPIFVDGNKTTAEIINTYPQIYSKATKNLLFLLLPDKSMNIKFKIKVDFSDGTTVSSDLFTENILVPIYEDSDDYYKLRNYIEKSHTESLTYGRGENIESSFLYYPEVFYNELNSQYDDY